MGVRELIRQRQLERSAPGARNDGAKLGLVIEGGGMRGVVSAGMVAGLESAGVLDCFDAVYGSSAGAINGAYFVAGQARYGTTIYYQDINNKAFIDMARWLTSRPPLSLEFLLDHVAETVKPLDWQAVIGSKIPLVVVASSLGEGRAVYMRDFRDKHDLRECLRGSARIPIVAGLPVSHRDKRLWDALVFEAIPVHAAAADGCTHVVGLLTRPQNNARNDLTPFEQLVIAHLIGRESKPAQKAYMSRVREYNQIVKAFSSGSISTNGKTVDALPIQIGRRHKPISGTETDRDTLVAGARAGFEAVYATLRDKVPQVIEVLTAF
jgi:predicted patatin/cPLA2 family phospholipase